MGINREKINFAIESRFRCNPYVRFFRIPVWKRENGFFEVSINVEAQWSIDDPKTTWEQHVFLVAPDGKIFYIEEKEQASWCYWQSRWFDDFALMDFEEHMNCLTSKDVEGTAKVRKAEKGLLMATQWYQYSKELERTHIWQRASEARRFMKRQASKARRRIDRMMTLSTMQNI